ncbi:MAG TPA: 4-(cytidine 5'-diphospho)-2-C-methyl-D-erythritol kinase [Candidatus Acidoferrales bacterium]|nr:4-(cytidine 5'-diphospho)-2-C-methyl-D-erythritol kinase [Candidatus Acidoferrales bacterium]
MRSVRLGAYAKVNLCLQVLGQRADGYHEVHTVFQAISLHDTLEISLKRGPSMELVVDSSALELSKRELRSLSGPGNLVLRAVEALRREFGIRFGARLDLVKRIPIGRGLGGGSSDAATALRGLLSLAGRKTPVSRLLQIASALGADVPFFLLGGRALGLGRGDEVYPLPDAPRRTLLVVSPRDIGVSTREAYGWLGRRLTRPSDASRLWSFCALCWSPLEAELSNDFEAVVFPRHPRLGKIKRELLERGAAEAALAGSGSAVFGVFRSPAQARRAAQGFPKEQVFVCNTLSRGEYRRAMGRRGSV